MKNIQKWQETEKTIFEVSKEAPNNMNMKELTKRIRTRPDIEGKDSNPEYDNVKVAIKDATLRLFSDKFGSYMENLFDKRMRLNVVPICFLTQLYNEQMSIKNKTNEVVIPFELKSFWKMEKAISLIGDLANIQMRQKLLFQNMTAVCASDEQKSKIKNILEVVDPLQILPPKDGKVVIKFIDLEFTINASNVKLDIIPLCKLLVKYYVKFVTSMDEAYDCFNTHYNKQKIYNARYNMEKLMEKYFTVDIKY